jgi:AraC-like DNA-binding protein
MLDGAQSVRPSASSQRESVSHHEVLACCTSSVDLPPSRWELHAHQGLEVGVVLAGAQEQEFGNVRVTRVPGEVWLLGPWEPHAWRVAAPGTAKVVAILRPEFLGEDPAGPAPYLGLFTAPVEWRASRKDPETREQAIAVGHDLAEAIAERGPYWGSLVRLHLLRLLMGQLRVRAGAQRREGKAGKCGENALGRILPAVELVHRDLGRRVSGAEAATACSLSVCRFWHVFREAMGLSFGAFALRARLARAAQQLLYTRASVREIAEEAGFADASHFHRLFVRHYGCTPGEYRSRAL